jgi:hypothetical protein
LALGRNLDGKLSGPLGVMVPVLLSAAGLGGQSSSPPDLGKPPPCGSSARVKGLLIGLYWRIGRHGSLFCQAGLTSQWSSPNSAASAYQNESGTTAPAGWPALRSIATDAWAGG